MVEILGRIRFRISDVPILKKTDASSKLQEPLMMHPKIIYFMNFLTILPLSKLSSTI